MDNQEKPNLSRPNELKENARVNSEVIDFVTGIRNTPFEAEKKKWSGKGINDQNSPFNRFHSVLQENFATLEPVDKLNLLLGAIKIVPDVTYSNLYQAGEKPFNEPHLQINETYQKNIGELFVRVLEFCNNDISQARNMLKTGRHYYSEPQKIHLLLLGFIANQSTNARLKQTPQEYTARNAQVPDLAFWAIADTNGFNPRSSNFNQLLESTYPKLTISGKIQVFKFLAEQTMLGKITPRKSRDVEIFLRKNLQLYEELKIKDPKDPFLLSYDLLGQATRINSMARNTKDGKIDIEDLTRSLELHPGLIDLVTTDELESALNQTKDHGLALRLERILATKGKPRSQMPQNPQPTK